MDFWINLRSQFWYLIAIMLFFSALCEGQKVYWQDSPDRENELKYEVGVKVIQSQVNHSFTYPGVLLNNRYVLTIMETLIYSYPFPASELRIVVNYRISESFVWEGEERAVLSVQIYSMFLLVSTESPLFMDDFSQRKYGCIELPTEDQALKWMKLDSLPNNAVYTSSCYTRTFNGLKLHVRKGKRSCKKNDLRKVPSFLLPTCLYTEEEPTCTPMSGSGLTWNKTLMGIRFHGTTEVPEPYRYDFRYDVYYSVIPVLQWIRSSMIHYKPCSFLTPVDIP